MHRTLVTALFAALIATASLTVAQTALAQQNRAQPEAPLQLTPNSDADALVCAAIQKLVEALGQALAAVPRYAPPETDSNGNIILRRLNPPGPSVTPDGPPSGWTVDHTSA